MASQDLFEMYKQGYMKAAAAVQELFDKLGNEQYTREQSSFLEQISARLSEMDRLLKKMKFEKNNAASGAAAQSQERALRTLESDIANMRQTFEAKKAQANRMSLYSGGQQSGANAAVRGQLLQNQSALDRSAARLEEGLLAMDETEQIGGDVLNSLAAQRETLEHSRNTLGSADERLTVARKHLVAMSRRLAANKAAMYFIIVVLVLTILYLIFRRFR